MKKVDNIQGSHQKISFLKEPARCW